MSMNRSQQHGFTLLELVIYIVVVSVGLVGILSVMNTVVKSSADPMVRKQALALAESILEEILQKEYDDPDIVQGNEATRATMDDVADYHGKTESLFTDWPAGLNGYQVAITVLTADLVVVGTSTVPAKKITVTVTDRDHVISLSGYRADY